MAFNVTTDEILFSILIMKEPVKQKMNYMYINFTGVS